ncbi:MAG: TetR/AcrR family transcriptional regulator [Erysipelotrichaceae bacterium]|nr:TetR/AcrR family transcriptional regulator [Erysipelotrichaceae bacterium]
MSEKTDRRIHKTKSAIKDSLKELLVSNKLEDITVQKLADEADITRKSFYNHYGNLYDVLDEIENDYLDYLFSWIDDVTRFFNTPRQFLIETVNRLNDTSDDFLLIARNSDIMRFLRKFTTRQKNVISGKYRQYYEISDFDLENLLTFISSGTLVVFYNWINDSGQHSLDDLKDFFNNVFTLQFWSQNRTVNKEADR